VELAKINLPAPDIAAVVATAMDHVTKMQATDDAEAAVAWSLSPLWMLANTHHSWRGEVGGGEVLDPSGQGGGPSPQPSPPKEISDVTWMHSGGEGGGPSSVLTSEEKGEPNGPRTQPRARASQMPAASCAASLRRSTRRDGMRRRLSLLARASRPSATRP
jgi:hypothetical protein